MTTIETFLAEHPRLAENTVAAYRRDLRQLERHLIGPNLCAKVDWPAVTAAHLIEWRTELARTCAPATVARKASAASAFLRWLGREELARAVRVHRTARSTEVPLTGADIERLVSATAGLHVNEALVWRDRAMIALLVGCGLTVSELIALDVDDVVGRVIRISGKAERDVPLSVEACDVLDDYLFDARSELDPRTPRRRRRARIERPETTALLLNGRGERLTRQGCSVVLAAVAKAAGLPGASPRRLRTTYAARLYAEGLDVREIATLLGIGPVAVAAHRPRRVRRAG